jgi:hypothetical protein
LAASRIITALPGIFEPLVVLARELQIQWQPAAKRAHLSDRDCRTVQFQPSRGLA